SRATSSATRATRQSGWRGRGAAARRRRAAGDRRAADLPVLPCAMGGGRLRARPRGRPAHDPPGRLDLRRRDAARLPAGPLPCRGADLVSGNRYLATYLNDHLAGATVGVELARRAAGSNKGSRYGAVLQDLSAEIAEDRTTLTDLMATVGVGRDRLKVLAAW